MCTAEIYANKDTPRIVEESEYLNHVVISDSKSAIQSIENYRSSNLLVQEIFDELIRLHNMSKMVQFFGSMVYM